MKHGIVATAITLLLVLPACSSEDAETPFVSSASAARSASPAIPIQPLYPPLQADADERQVYEYH